MERSVSILIYFYIFICFSLLVFNIAYIFRSKGRTRKRLRQERKWLNELEQEWENAAAGEEITARHMARLNRKLSNVELLLPYHEAVQKGMERYSDGRVQCYLDQCHIVFQMLGVTYAGKTAMERAFYAYLMAVYHPNRKESRNQFSQILLTYFDDSTVFCRENILQALYAFGSESAVVNAYSLMNERGWYHHARLLSDGLATFSGDRTKLVWALWRQCRSWESSFQVAVVQFATTISDEFAEEFFVALRDNGADLEMRYAILRYFRRWYYPPAKQTLLELLSKNENDLGIVAATALETYPGEDARKALIDAMRSRNWYVRRNAAETLVRLGSSYADVEKLRGEDRYGAEMLEYMLERSGMQKGAMAVGERQAVMA